MGEERVADGYKSVTGYDRWEQICPCAMEGHEGHLDHTAHKGDGLVSGEKADQQPEGEQGGRTESTLRRKFMGWGGWSWRGSGLSHPGAHQSPESSRKMAKRNCFWSARSVRPSRMNLVTGVILPQCHPTGVFSTWQ